MMRVFLSLAALLLASGSAAAQAVVDTTARPVSLADAIRMAQQNAPSNVQARGAISTSEAAVKQSYAAFLPSFTLSAGRRNERG